MPLHTTSHDVQPVFFSIRQVRTTEVPAFIHVRETTNQRTSSSSLSTFPQGWNRLNTWRKCRLTAFQNISTRFNVIFHQIPVLFKHLLYDSIIFILPAPRKYLPRPYFSHPAICRLITYSTPTSKPSISTFSHLQTNSSGTLFHS